MRRFRHLRRLSAVVAQLLLVQLAFVSGAGACPLDGGAASTAGMAMTDMGASHGQHHGTPADAPTDHAPASPASHHHAGVHCDMACAPTNCGAASHCPVSAQLDGTATNRPLATVRSLTPIGGDAMLQSVSTAPEPPPPRA